MKVSLFLLQIILRRSFPLLYTFQNIHQTLEKSKETSVLLLFPLRATSSLSTRCVGGYYCQNKLLSSWMAMYPWASVPVFCQSRYDTSYSMARTKDLWPAVNRGRLLDLVRCWKILQFHQFDRNRIPFEKNFKEEISEEFLSVRFIIHVSTWLQRVTVFACLGFHYSAVWQPAPSLRPHSFLYFDWSQQEAVIS